MDPKRSRARIRNQAGRNNKTNECSGCFSPKLLAFVK